MKRFTGLLLLLVFLPGCSSGSKEMARCLELRSRILAGSKCSFTADILADYGNTQHKFTLQCQADEAGAVTFSVLKPASIGGISGIIDGKDGKLTMDDTVLYFPLLADGQLSPICAPWILMKTLRSGYIESVGTEGDGLWLTIDDSYDDDALQLDILTDADKKPTHAQILYRGHKILSLDVKDFRIE